MRSQLSVWCAQAVPVSGCGVVDYSGLEAKILASASNICPRPGLDLVVLLCNRAFSGKDRVKFGNFNFLAIILNRMLLIIIWSFFHNYFWPRPCPQPPEIGLGLGLEVLASFNITDEKYITFGVIFVTTNHRPCLIKRQ